MTLSELTELIRWGWANDREAALIPFFMLAYAVVAEPASTAIRAALAETQP